MAERANFTLEISQRNFIFADEEKHNKISLEDELKVLATPKGKMTAVSFFEVEQPNCDNKITAKHFFTAKEGLELVNKKANSPFITIKWTAVNGQTIIQSLDYRKTILCIFEEINNLDK